MYSLLWHDYSMSLVSFCKKLRAHWKKTSLHPLQKVSLFGIAILTGLTFSIGTLTDTGIERLNSMLSAVLPGAVVELTNAERIERNLASLTRSPVLDEAARLKATHMRDNNYFEHYSPTGVSPWYWFDVAGYDYIHAGENLAVFFDDSEEVVHAWMDSPLHRDNILKAEYTEIGVATVEAIHKGYRTVFVVQLFGTPAPSAIASESIARAEKIPEERTVPPVQAPTETIPNAPPEQTPDPIESEPEAPTTTDLAPEITEPTTIERLPIEDTTVYVANHMTTSTLAYTNPSEHTILGDSTSAPMGTTPITVLYYTLALLVSGMLVGSIFHATKKSTYIQVAYGIALLCVTTGAIALHAHVVQAVAL